MVKKKNNPNPISLFHMVTKFPHSNDCLLMAIDDHDIFKSMLQKLESIDNKFNSLDRTIAGLSPIIIEQGRRVTKVEDLAETLRIDVNSIASMQREMKAQYTLLAGIIGVSTPIVSILISKWIG